MAEAIFLQIFWLIVLVELDGDFTKLYEKVYSCAGRVSHGKNE